MAMKSAVLKNLTNYSRHGDCKRIKQMGLIQAKELRRSNLQLTMLSGCYVRSLNLKRASESDKIFSVKCLSSPRGRSFLEKEAMLNNKCLF